MRNVVTLLIQKSVHEKVHEERVNNEYKCGKCEKVYGSMSKLRRHDWRSHREVECTICGETLKSRHDISCHRQTKHEIKTIAKCKFFRGFIEEDECFF